MRNKSIRLNVQYATINALLLAQACGTMGFAANFLLGKGFSNSLFGIVMTAVSIVGAVFQAVFAPIIDRSDTISEKKFISWTLAVAIAGSVMLLFVKSIWLLIPVVIVTYATTAAAMPFLNSIAFLYEREGVTINYGVSRGMGSAAYAVAGWVFGQFLISHSTALLPWFYIVLSGLTLLAVVTLPDPSPLAEADASFEQGKDGAASLSYPDFFRKYRILALVFCGMALMYICHTLINNFMINVVGAIVGADGASGYQGTAVFIQAMVELPTMFLFAQIMRRFSIDRLMAFAAVMYSVKHVVVFASVLTGSIALYYLGMALQMLSYAVLIPSSVYFANEVCDASDRNKGQSVMALASTVGGLFASFVGGILFDALPVSGVMGVGAVVSVLGTALVVLAMRRRAV